MERKSEKRNVYVDMRDNEDGMYIFLFIFLDKENILICSFKLDLY